MIDVCLRLEQLAAGTMPGCQSMVCSVGSAASGAVVALDPAGTNALRWDLSSRSTNKDRADHDTIFCRIRTVAARSFTDR